jgi:hypothetical protein
LEQPPDKGEYNSAAKSAEEKDNIESPPNFDVITCQINTGNRFNRVILSLHRSIINNFIG